MKIIDFHVHTFPDKIASGALTALEKESNVRRHTDGTNDGLRRSMEKAGIAFSVIQPVVTNPAKASHINQVAAKVNDSMRDTGLISFGGIHPECGNYRELLQEVKELGLKGIKLHPDYYGISFNDIRVKRIISYATELGLIVITHAGIDIGLYPPTCCTVDNVLEVMRDVEPDRLVLAHMGGWMLWDEVIERLAGESVWIDTAFSIGEIDWIDRENHKPFHMLSDKEFIKMVDAFGAEKILFATDSPWSDQKEYVDRIKAMPIADADKDRIFGKNAAGLLGIEDFCLD